MPASRLSNSSYGGGFLAPSIIWEILWHGGCRAKNRVMLGRMREKRMSGAEDDPLEFGDLADEARAIAERMTDSGAKETLLSIARAYEAMLKRGEKKPAGH
jgi:hypothetical protein